MAAGFVWILGRSHFDRMGMKLKKGAWEKKQQKQSQLQYEVDRILAKVHEQGIHNLTRKEKQILQKATEEQKRV
jgi:dipeptidase